MVVWDLEAIHKSAAHLKITILVKQQAQQTIKCTCNLLQQSLISTTLPLIKAKLLKAQVSRHTLTSPHQELHRQRAQNLRNCKANSTVEGKQSLQQQLELVQALLDSNLTTQEHLQVISKCHQVLEHLVTKYRQREPSVSRLKHTLVLLPISN